MRPDAAPAIMIMGDYAQIDPADLPEWGPVGCWKYWAWDNLNPASNAYAWPIIDKYLDAAMALGKPCAISIMPYTSPSDATKADKTPQWVYSSSGQKPWDDGYGGTYPAWNSWPWDKAFSDFVAAFGARFDGDPRVHSVWICTAHYGETVVKSNGVDMTGHNPGRFFTNTLSWYHQAFPSTPLYMLCTGPTDRKALAELAWARGINIKYNGLNRDLGNQYMLQPTPGGGLMQLAHEATERGYPTAWEHAYNLTHQGETYWAMITGLANGMEVLDLPVQGLETLASIPGLWEWVLGIMAHPRERVAMWIARDTRNPPPGNGYESGFPGPWVRGDILVNAQVGASGSPLHRSAPGTMTNALYGYGGVGWCKEKELTVAVDLPPGNYDVQLVSGVALWQTVAQVIQIDGLTTIVFPGERWVHRVVVTPSEDEPPPPPPPPPDLTELFEEVQELKALQALDLIELAKQAAAITDLDRATVRLLERLGAVDDKLAGVRNALN